MDKERRAEVEATFEAMENDSATAHDTRWLVEELFAALDALTPDAELGAAVRRMEVGNSLWYFPLEEAAEYTSPSHYSPEHWELIGNEEEPSRILGVGPTPEAALAAAGLMGDDDA